ncbi:MAG: amidohydrolase family protein, partial [Myxococcota bacterium]|nr:amidohydrolase family protein [Myxococcota bacterium]
DAELDVLVDGSRIAGVGRDLAAEGARRLDCRGSYVLPGLVDLCSVLGEPGMAWRETLQTGAQAAAAGGFTTVVASPATDPVVDRESTAVDCVARMKNIEDAELLQAGALTMGLDGKELAELGLMLEAGCVVLSDGGRGIADSLVLRNALDYVRAFSGLVVHRPVDPVLEGRGCMHEGETSTRIGLHGVPGEAEEIGVARAICLARLTGARIHLSHVTTRASLVWLRRAREEQLPVTAGVPARHLLLTDRDVEQSGYDPSFHLAPPLRPEADRLALVEAVRSGLVDCVHADHVPWSRVEKEHEFARTEPGAVGLESALAAAWTALGTDPATVARSMAVNPAALLGRTPRIEEGARADLCVVREGPRTVSASRRSLGCNEPLVDREVNAAVVATISRGHLAAFLEGIVIA